MRGIREREVLLLSAPGLRVLFWQDNPKETMTIEKEQGIPFVWSWPFSFLSAKVLCQGPEPGKGAKTDYVVTLIISFNGRVP